MNEADIEKALAELEKMRANKSNMSNAQLTEWIQTHPEITAECCDCSVDEVLANPANYIEDMINDK